MKKLKTTEFVSGFQSLICPLCGDVYTHVVGVDVFSRNEDATDGIHVSAKNIDCDGVTAVSIDSDISGNTSTRRGSVHLFVSCEICGDVSRIEFNQHKGVTYVEIFVEEDMES